MARLKIAIASDHAGYAFKTELTAHLETLGYEFVDLGTHSDASVDYPDYANLVCNWIGEQRSKASPMKPIAAAQSFPNSAPNSGLISEPISAPLVESISGILICGSGQGMCMRANKFPFIRAALCWSVDSARLSREHNDANVLCLAARLIDKHSNFQIVETFLQTAFLSGRHQVRVQKMGLIP